MKSITFKEIINQLNDPDFAYAYLLSENFDGVGVAEATSHHVLDENEIKFYFENFDTIVFKRDTMNAKTDGSSIFMVDTNGCNYELLMFKTVQMTF